VDVLNLVQLKDQAGEGSRWRISVRILEDMPARLESYSWGSQRKVERKELERKKKPFLSRGGGGGIDLLCRR